MVQGTTTSSFPQALDRGPADKTQILYAKRFPKRFVYERTSIAPEFVVNIA